jgi:hypothetical protein
MGSSSLGETLLLEEYEPKTWFLKANGPKFLTEMWLLEEQCFKT